LSPCAASCHEHSDHCERGAHAAGDISPAQIEDPADGKGSDESANVAEHGMHRERCAASRGLGGACCAGRKRGRRSKKAPLFVGALLEKE